MKLIMFFISFLFNLLTQRNLSSLPRMWAPWTGWKNKQTKKYKKQNKDKNKLKKKKKRMKCYILMLYSVIYNSILWY